MNSKQILGNAPSQERLGQFRLRGGEETNMQCSSGCLGGAALQNLEVKGAKVGKISEGREAGKHIEVAKMMLKNGTLGRRL